MKKQKLSKKAAAYLKRIEACTDRNEIEGIRIEFSQDCSASSNILRRSSTTLTLARLMFSIRILVSLKH